MIIERKIIGTINANCSLCNYEGKINIIKTKGKRELEKFCNNCTPKELKTKSINCMYKDSWCFNCGECLK